MSFCLSVGLLVCALFSADAASAQNDSPFDWRSEWAVVNENFSVTVDSEGYHFPTAIAFVPQPGEGPKDPLYFVTELRGKVKVVTNDRSVYTFAEDFFKFTPKDELPRGYEGQSGLAAICLEPKRGYVFVTFIYRDENKDLRNDIIRFQSKPGTFSIRATSQLNFTEVLSADETGVTHQIGHCQIHDDLLFVGVGDGWQPNASQGLNSTLGKILRMTLDGKPVPDNPFYRDADVKKAANYVWSYGLRNPFGLKIVENRVFLAENGVHIDRFMEIHEGRNYLWDGTDLSIGTNAAVVFAPSVSPTQVDFYTKKLNLFPKQYEEHFFVALAGTIKKSQPRPGAAKGILTLNYGLKEGRMRSPPKYFLKYTGSGYSSVVGLSFGPDGLYFAPLFANREGRSPVYKVMYDPSHQYPYTFAKDRNPFSIMSAKGCFGCHSLNGKGGAAGPALDRGPMVTRTQKRLNSEVYLQSLEELDELDRTPFRDYKEARKEVVNAKGIEKVRTWMKYHIQEPRFDNRYSQMPNLGITENEALLITDYLLKYRTEPTFLQKLRASLPRPRGFRHLVFSFVGGIFATILVVRFLRKRRVG